MSYPNSWRAKREEQHEAHNRKPGAAKFWKGKRNKFTRRWDSRIRKDQTHYVDIRHYESDRNYPKQIEGPLEVMITKAAQTGHRVLDLLDEETRRELSNNGT